MCDQRDCFDSKTNLGILAYWNICNGRNWVNKNRLISWAKQIFEKRVTGPNFWNCVCSSGFFLLINKIFEYSSTQIFEIKISKWVKAISYHARHTSLKNKIYFKTDYAHFSKPCLLRSMILVKSNTSEFLNSQIFAMKGKESIKTSCHLIKQTSLNLSIPVKPLYIF